MKLKSKKPIISLMIIFSVLSILLLGYIVQEERKYINDESLKKIEFIGKYYINEELYKIQLSDDTKFDLHNIHRLTLTGHFNEDIKENEKLIFRVVNLKVAIYVNDRKVFSYGDKGMDTHIAKSLGNGWITFVSPGLSSNDDILIELTNIYDNNFSNAYNKFIRNIYKGDEITLLRQMLLKDSIRNTLALLIVIIGIILLFILVILRLLKVVRDYAPIDLSIFMIAGGLWLLVDFNFISLIIPYGIFNQVLYRIFQFMVIPLIILYILNFIEGKARHYLILTEYILLSFNIVYVILQWFGILDSYEMLTLYDLLLIGAFCLNFGSLIREARKNNNIKVRFLLISVTIMIVVAMWDIVNYFLDIVQFNIGFEAGLIIFTVMNFYYTVEYIKEKLIKAKQVQKIESELIQSRITVMMSQIQPHFLYNSLIAIQQLCDEEPAKAEEAIGNFALFLRGNLDSLSTVKPIEFIKELNHIKTYLELEKMRFGHRLNVVYDINCNKFMIPSLTVQPLVENAVRYGISKKPLGGTVTITTKETEKEILIIVDDDGIGFDVNKIPDDSRSHIGIDNVSKRLLAQCRGTVEIKSVQGVGTTVKIRIPKEE